MIPNDTFYFDLSASVSLLRLLITTATNKHDNSNHADITLLTQTNQQPMDFDQRDGGREEEEQLSARGNSLSLNHLL